MNDEQLRSLLHTGRVVRVRFVKRTNGKIREIVGRTGVRKGVNGKGAKYSFKDRGLVVLEDFGLAKTKPTRECYRAVPIDGILEITADGVKYRVRPDPPGAELEEGE